jgi:hypothetical protein
MRVCRLKVSDDGGSEPGANVKKLFTAASYDFSYNARAFFPGKPFQPSLMFVGKAKSLP